MAALLTGTVAVPLGRSADERAIQSESAQAAGLAARSPHLIDSGSCSVSSSLLTILAAPRTGSSLLCALVQNHPDAVQYWELFRNTSENGELSAADLAIGSLRTHNINAELLQAIESGRRAPGRLLDQLVSDCPGQRRVQAFKLFGTDSNGNPHLPRGIVRDQVIGSSRRGRFIILFRRNVLEVFVSQLAAALSDVWAGAGTQGQVHVDPLNFAAFEEQYLEWYAWAREELNRAGKPFLELEYNELAADLDTTWERVQRFLDIPAMSVSTTYAGEPLLAGWSVTDFEKQSATPLSTRISNFDELLDIDREKFAGYANGSIVSGVGTHGIV